MERQKHRRYTLEQCSRGGRNKPRHDETFEEVLGRFRDDRKGLVIAEGVTYTAKGESTWQVRHSTAHANQFDVVADGKVITRGNPRNLPTPWIRKKARQTKEENKTYLSLHEH